MNEIIFQIIIITLITVIITLISRILHRWWPKWLHNYTVWPLIMGYFSLLNLSWQWFPYPVMGWAVIGIIIMIGQIILGGELIYGRFWNFFWAVTVIYGTLTYFASVIYAFLG